jgi:hypothetical protein
MSGVGGCADGRKDAVPPALLGTPQGRRLLAAFDSIADLRLCRKALELVEAIAQTASP